VKIIMQVLKGVRPKRPTPEDCICSMTDDMWQLIQDGWHQTPKTRPSMAQFEEHFRSVNTTNISSQQRPSTTSCRLRALVDIPIRQASVRPLGVVMHSPPRAAVTRKSISLPGFERPLIEPVGHFPCEHYGKGFAVDASDVHFTQPSKVIQAGQRERFPLP
jgi:hypothetical protein